MIERLETARRKSLAWLNSRYFYGRVPFLHTLVFLVEMAILIRLVTKFNSYYARKPLLTTMLTNALLGGIADTVAQSITAYQVRARSLPQRANTAAFVSSDGVELDDFTEKPIEPPPRPAPIHLTPAGPPPFDFERLTRFMAYGFLMSPVQYTWYNFLHRTFPITSGRALTPALQRVAFDQLIFAPCGLTCFFYIYDAGRGRRSCGAAAQIRRCLRADPARQLHPLAGGADRQFPRHAHPISDPVREHGGHCLDGVSESDEFE